MTVFSSLIHKYRYVVQQLQNERGRQDYVFTTAIDEMYRDGILTEELLDVLVTVIHRGLVRNQKAFLRHSFKSRDFDKVRQYCRFVSLYVDDAPKLSHIYVASIMKLVEELFASSDDGEKAGAAHGLVALLHMQLSAKIKVRETLDELSSVYDDRLQLFAEHHGKTGEMHRFIKERGLDIREQDDFSLLRGFVESYSQALASGTL